MSAVGPDGWAMAKSRDIEWGGFDSISGRFVGAFGDNLR
jgi:hypothetical protein